MMIAQLPGVDRRLTLLNRKLIEHTPQGTSETLLPGDEAVLDTLARDFSLYFPPETRFRYEIAAAV
jgi:hypothetical protein